MSLVDRIDPPPARHVFRWDLDKTYLRTDFDTIRQLVKTALEKASEKVNVPGTAALMRELKREETRVLIVSGSPRQMRRVIEDKLRLDGVVWDELVLKDNLGNVLRGRFRSMRNQVGYKLPVLLESRLRYGLAVPETLFGDDAEADAFVYSLYADIVAGRVSRELMSEVMEAARLYPDERGRLLQFFDELTKAREKAGGLVGVEPVRRIFIHLDKLTPPTRFSAYGPRLVPIYNYFQSALVLHGRRAAELALGDQGRARDGAGLRLQPHLAVELVPGSDSPRDPRLAGGGRAGGRADNAQPGARGAAAGAGHPRGVRGRVASLGAPPPAARRRRCGLSRAHRRRATADGQEAAAVGERGLVGAGKRLPQGSGLELDPQILRDRGGSVVVGGASQRRQPSSRNAQAPSWIPKF